MSDGILFSVISISFLLLLANLILFLSKKVKLPFAVLLVLVGASLYPLRQQGGLFSLQDINLTPELLFFVFLPALLFESSFNIDFRKLSKDIDIVILLATAGVLISTIITGFLVSNFINLPLPIAFLFAAVISSTDPIAVISIFKELGIPKRLIQLVDSESMLNDGTSLILSKFVSSSLAIGIAGGSLVTDLMSGIESFFYVIIVSVGLGVFVGVVTAKVIEKIKNEFLIEVSITLAVSYLTFIVSEEFLGSSGIISTVLTGVILGNYGRDKFSPKVKHLLKEIWEYISFVANSLVFILVGATYGIRFLIDYWPQIILASIAVYIGRAVAVYSMGWLHNTINKEKSLPLSWIHILWWGGMRGALPIAVISYLTKGIDNDSGILVAFENDLLFTTVGVVFFSLVVSGLTMRPLIRLLKVDKPKPQETIERLLIKALVLNKAIKRIKHLEKLGEISGSHRFLDKKFLLDFRRTTRNLRSAFEDDPILFQKTTFTYAFHIEREVFIKLREKNIIPSKILRRLENKLLHGIDLIDKGIFPRDFAKTKSMQKIAFNSRKNLSLEEVYLYRKAREFANLEVLSQLESFIEIPVLEPCMANIAENYREFYEKNKRICKALEEKNASEIVQFEEHLCYNEFLATEEDVLNEMEVNGKVSKAVLTELQQSLFKVAS